MEGTIAQKAKEVTIGGKDWANPTPDNAESMKEGAEHFQHHCQIFHGLDGQNTGVPFADKMSPAVADLASKPVQEMWHIVRYDRHLPQKGIVGVPSIYEAHEHGHH